MTYTYSSGFDRNYGFRSAASHRDRIARIDALATLLDTAFILPGTNVRFGLDAIIGLVPGIGDAITTVMSLYIVHEARQPGAAVCAVSREVGGCVTRDVCTELPHELLHLHSLC